MRKRPCHFTLNGASSKYPALVANSIAYSRFIAASIKMHSRSQLGCPSLPTGFKNTYPVPSYPQGADRDRPLDRKGKDRFQSHSNQYNLNQYYFLVIFGIPES